VSGTRLAITTVPDAEVAATIARLLVESRLAACVSVVPGLRSTYRWKGAVMVEDEVMLLVKTSAARLDEARAALVAAHPYEVPELLVLDVDDVPASYAAWLLESTSAP